MEQKSKQNKELVIIRVFNAPRDIVFKMWTEAEHLAKWWGPKGFDVIVKKLELKPGGVFHYCMAKNDMEMWGKFVYREIVAPEKLVFINSFSDKDGNITRSPFMANWPLEVLNTLTFKEQDGKTTVTLKGGPCNATEEEQNIFAANTGSMQQGFAGTFEQLDEYLAAITI